MFRSADASLIGFVKADTFDNAFVYNAWMGTESTLAAFASLDHVSRPWQPALRRGFEPFVGVSDTPQAVLDENLRIAIKGIDVRFTTVLRHDLGEGRELAVADVGSRSGLVGGVWAAGENGSLSGRPVASRAAIILHDLNRKSGFHTLLVLATCCLPTQGPMPLPKVSHHA